MKSTFYRKLPTYENFDDLSCIATAVEDIISDAYGTGDSLYGGGLLGSVVLAEMPKSPASRLRTLLNHPDAFLYEPARRVVKILPGVDSIGKSRSERLGNLLKRLPELTAYKWLRSQPSYSSAYETAKNLAQREFPYQGDTLEFLLLVSLALPFGRYALRKSNNLNPSYPTLDELTEAYKNVAALSSFFNTKSSIYGVLNVPLGLASTLKSIEVELRRKKRGYRKPREDSTLLERELRNDLFLRLMNCFGDCSVTLLRHLLGIVGYTPDARTIDRYVKDKKAELRIPAIVKALREGKTP